MGDNQKMKVLYFIEFLKLEKRICPQNQDLLHVGRDMAVFMKCLPFNVRKRPYLKLLKEKFNKAKITNWVKFAYIFNRQIAHTTLYELAIEFWVEIYFQSIRDIQTKKRGNLGNGRDLFWNGLTPHPLKSTWDFSKSEWTPKIFRNKLNMKNIGTKSVNMSDIMVYLAMFSATIDQIFCFWVLIWWKWVII